jgi:hypothetical protein
MSVLLYDPAEKRHVLVLNEGPWAGKRWSVEMSVCDNPLCGCFHVGLLCLPQYAAQDPRAEPASFVLDTHERSIYRPSGHKVSAISDSLGEAVVRELGEAGWKYLYEFLLGVKQEQIENCDPRRLDADFPPEVLRGDTTVVGYGEIFPLSPALAFAVGSQEWTAIDDYCVNPDCDCRHVVLQFVTDEHEHSRSPRLRKVPPAVYYDYKERTFKEAHAPEAHQPSLATLVAGVRDRWPGFEREVKKRHRRMRVLFKRALRKYEASADPNQPKRNSGAAPLSRSQPEKTPAGKTGRNDPCPCGSGRKYKKCCGR